MGLPPPSPFHYPPFPASSTCYSSLALSLVLSVSGVYLHALYRSASRVCMCKCGRVRGFFVYVLLFLSIHLFRAFSTRNENRCWRLREAHRSEEKYFGTSVGLFICLFTRHVSAMLLFCELPDVCVCVCVCVCV
jgi:hypothetical protein